MISIAAQKQHLISGGKIPHEHEGHIEVIFLSQSRYSDPASLIDAWVGM